MAQQVNSGTMLACSFGVAPSTLTITPENRVMAGSTPAATIMDYIPMKNVAPFGMCSAPTNPQVAAATAAALGVLTPQPCMPATSSPWTPGSPGVTIANKPALTTTCQLLCMWGGIITITNPSQQTVNAA
jgi:hypothetical protein